MRFAFDVLPTVLPRSRTFGRRPRMAVYVAGVAQGILEALAALGADKLNRHWFPFVFWPGMAEISITDSF